MVVEVAEVQPESVSLPSRIAAASGKVVEVLVPRLRDQLPSPGRDRWTLVVLGDRDGEAVSAP
jgi:hypothetical protein